MEEKAQAERRELDLKNLSTGLVLDQDRQYIEGEKQRSEARSKALAKVSLRNKEVTHLRPRSPSCIQSSQMMDNKREYDQWNRVHQWHVERAMLADSPINWSKTLT